MGHGFRLGEMAMFSRTAGRFIRNGSGGVAVIFALALVPVGGIMAGAVDYTRAVRIQAHLQNGLDAAVLAAARLGPDEKWAERGADVFRHNSPGEYATANPSFVRHPDGRVVGEVDVIVETQLVRMIGFKSLNVGVESTALVKQNYADSCILALDSGGDPDDQGILFNGAPKIDLNKCTLRSNTSLRCNGHDSGTVASIAAGSAAGCRNPTSQANIVPDILAPVAASIQTRCGSLSAGVTWKPGAIPPTVVTVNRNTHVEYHVCGDLTLAGSGYLTGSAPSRDSVIVIENGSLIVADARIRQHGADHPRPDRQQHEGKRREFPVRKREGGDVERVPVDRPTESLAWNIALPGSRDLEGRRQ